jgi:hypothetical protein
LAKRFTETTKWQKEWYRLMGPKLRDLRSYLLDACDHAGILDVDLGTISHFVGWDVSVEDINESLRNRGVWHPGSSRKLFIPDFIEFQYGDASNQFKARLSALKKIESLGFLNSCRAVKEIEGNRLVTVTEQLTNCPSNSNSTGKSKRRGCGGNEETLEAILTQIPRETKTVWDQLYPAEFVDREVLRAWGYYQGDKKPKRLNGWSRAFSSWLERSWKWEQKALESGSPSDTFCGIVKDV